MAKELKVKIREAYDTEANWKKLNPVLLPGQLAFSSDKNGKYKIGDGTKTWSQLSYNTLSWEDIVGKPTTFSPSQHNHDDKYYTETEINGKLNTKANLSTVTGHIENTGIHITTDERTKWNAAKSHADKAHAPSNAQANIIETVKINGVSLVPIEKAVNVKIPTKLSELTNDSGYIKTDTKYTLETPASTANGSVKLNLVGTDNENSSVGVKGSGSATVTTDSTGIIIINATDTKYTHPTSGVSAGTYKSVTVNAQGHVTAGTNPTTLAGFGITDAAAKTHNHSASQINGLPTSLKSPYALIVKTNGTTVATYDGSSTKEVNITPAAIGAAATSHGTHVPSTCNTITDWNTATKTGWYMGSSAKNAPTSVDWYFGYVICHNTSYVIQEVYKFTASSDAKYIPKYIRACANGTWGSWTNVTVAKAVPANAVFTDTKYTLSSFGITASAGELNYCDGVTSNIQTQLNGKSSSSHNHDSVYAKISHTHTASQVSGLPNIIAITNAQIDSLKSL